MSQAEITSGENGAARVSCVIRTSKRGQIARGGISWTFNGLQSKSWFQPVIDAFKICFLNGPLIYWLNIYFKINDSERRLYKLVETSLTLPFYYLILYLTSTWYIFIEKSANSLVVTILNYYLIHDLLFKYKVYCWYIVSLIFLLSFLIVTYWKKVLHIISMLWFVHETVCRCIISSLWDSEPNFSYVMDISADINKTRNYEKSTWFFKTIFDTGHSDLDCYCVGVIGRQ